MKPKDSRRQEQDLRKRNLTSGEQTTFQLTLKSPQIFFFDLEGRNEQQKT